MRPTKVLLAAVALAAPGPLMAQINQTGELEYGETQQTDDNDNSRLGLLGLLGLAGLLGLRRREPDIHVDARRDKRG
ncbi:MAG TPA: WGxxGxxG family protein [Sphingomicrobium sp.]|nr:WGxxGxxG family protein [Sphingomicrobium sp.]